MFKYFLVAITAGFLFAGSAQAQTTTVGSDGTTVQTDTDSRQEK